MSFQRRVENFTCEHCSASVKGDGYTNHCPQCLWSKHVDINPGDRREYCGGLMEPLAIEGGSPDYDIVHQCTICGQKRVNKTVKNDNNGSLIALARKSAAESK